ncbi:hypothetical protein SOVF_018920, partial [Spinacia oleracea]
MREKLRERKRKKKKKPYEIPKTVLGASASFLPHSFPWICHGSSRSLLQNLHHNRFTTSQGNYYPRTYLIRVLITVNQTHFLTDSSRPLDLNQTTIVVLPNEYLVIYNSNYEEKPILLDFNCDFSICRHSLNNLVRACSRKTRSGGVDSWITQIYSSTSGKCLYLAFNDAFSLLLCRLWFINLCLVCFLFICHFNLVMQAIIYISTDNFCDDLYVLDAQSITYINSDLFCVDLDVLDAQVSLILNFLYNYAICLSVLYVVCSKPVVLRFYRLTSILNSKVLHISMIILCCFDFLVGWFTMALISIMYHFSGHQCRVINENVVCYVKFSMLQSSAVMLPYVCYPGYLTYLAPSIQSASFTEFYDAPVAYFVPCVSYLWYAYFTGFGFQIRLLGKLRYPISGTLLVRLKISFVKLSSNKLMFDDAPNNSPHSWPENFITLPSPLPVRANVLHRNIRCIHSHNLASSNLCSCPCSISDFIYIDVSFVEIQIRHCTFCSQLCSWRNITSYATPCNQFVIRFTTFELFPFVYKDTKLIWVLFLKLMNRSFNSATESPKEFSPYRNRISKSALLCDSLYIILSHVRFCVSKYLLYYGFDHSLKLQNHVLSFRNFAWIL